MSETNQIPQLTTDFLVDLFNASIKSKTIFEICVPHIEFSYFPHETYKKVWKYMQSHYSLHNNVPSIGMLAQTFIGDEKVTLFLGDIKKAPIADKEGVLNRFEHFLKECKFFYAYEHSTDEFNRGNKEKAYSIMTEFAGEVNLFSLKTNYFEPVFKGFSKRYTDKSLSKVMVNINEAPAIVYGIDQFDAIAGTPKPGDTILLIAQSGVGKSQALKWISISNARRGIKVAHFQLEGTKDECTDAYDAAWTGALHTDIENANLTQVQIKAIEKTIQDIQGEIYIDCAEMFDSINMAMIDSKIGELQKLHGPIGLVVIDYLQLANPGDGKKYDAAHERQRLDATATKMKNVAIKHNVPIITAAQASDVKKEFTNNPKFVLTRNNIAEFKGLINSFSVVATLNQTDEEYEEELIRIYFDKLRKRKARQMFTVAQNRTRGRFYDKKRTLDLFAIENN